MTNNIYALLVGIDNYSTPVAPLRGRINDITVVEEYLRDRIADEQHQLHILTLLCESCAIATRTTQKLRD